MSKNHKVLPKKATHVLHVLKDSHMIIAFDRNRNRGPLQEGEYEFFYDENPCNPKIRALHIVKPKNGLYVSEHFLKTLDREFWSVKTIKSRS